MNKRIISIVLTVTIVLSVTLGVNIMYVHGNSAGEVVEAESGTRLNDMQMWVSPDANKGQCIGVVSGARLDSPAALSSPDASYTIHVATAGSYKVYMRAYAPSGGANSYWYRWDGESYTQRDAIVGSDWSWQESNAISLSVGTHTLDICHREPGYYIDFLVIATNLTTEQKEAIDAGIGMNDSTAVAFNTSFGSAMLEAEDLTLNASLFGVAADVQASDSNVISASLTQTSPTPGISAVGAEFNIIPDRTANYDIWLRYSAISAGQDSIWYSFDDADYRQINLPISGSDPSDYQWVKLDTTSELLYYAMKYNFKLHPREMGTRIDKIIVTSYPFLNPSGMVTTLDDIAFHYSLPSNVYPEPTLTPPAAHPRLYLRSSDVDTIKANMQKTQNANAMISYNALLAQDVDGILDTFVVLDENADTTMLSVIEAYALKCALDGDAAYGAKAVMAMKNYINTLTIKDSYQFLTRNVGHVINVAAEVYDWCYPLLTAEDKDRIITGCEAYAKRMEVGYPPSGQGAVTGHGGEAQLFRDLLSLGIAAYNERPDIYNYVVGRLLSEYIEPRDYWYGSNTHHQGDSYGQYRYLWEMMFQWTMERMSGNTMFSPDAEFVPYEWIYTRRPDGQLFRNGDDYHEKTANIGTYWTSDSGNFFYSSNFYGNSFVKAQYIAQDPDLNTFSNADLSTVKFLLFNNPDLAGQSHTAAFPLTKYFGSPYGMMVARTGWTEPGAVDITSNVAMAQMVIGEQWAANHQHLDAGTFQLYYKGALASESGVYDGYGSSHDYNYNKATIAHNGLLIHNSNESTGAVVNSGGQKRPGGEVNTFSQWMGSGYDRAVVLDHEYDASSTVPQYSYIKGDITKAYTDKVSQVVRSMLFTPLSDASHPAALVVMDKVTSSNPSFKKTWLLHSQQEPSVIGNTATIQRNTNGYNGRMDLTTLLPLNASLTKVGGAGHEFDINGTNYPPTGSFGTACEKGAWRIEVSPVAANATDYFLNVMQVSDDSANATPLAATLIETDLVAGAKISDRVAVFGKDADRMNGVVSFTVPGSEQSGLKITVSGMEEGDWNVYCNSALTGTYTSSEEGGTLYFEGGAGSYILIPMGEAACDTSISTLSYTHRGTTTDITLTDTNRYTAYLRYGTTVMPEISATAENPLAVVDIAAPVAFPGEGVVTVTSVNGLYTKKYHIYFTYAPGNITNLTNNLSTKTYKAFSSMQPQTLPELRELFTDVGSSWENYCRSFVDRSVTAISNTLGGANIPVDPSVTQIPSGQNWFLMWLANGTVNGDTSSCFNGASWIATSNDDNKVPNLSQYLTETHPDGITFDIDRPATVWVALNSTTTFQNFADEGWTLVQPAAGYKVVHADGSRYMTFYTKYFEPGEVQIPTYGRSTSLPGRGFIPIVVWKDDRDDASLSSLSYTHPELGDQTVTVVPGTTTYNIELPYGISSDIPQVSATITDQEATLVSVTQAAAVDGEATIVVMAPNGDETTYTIDFTVSQTPFSAGNGTVTNLKYRGTPASGNFMAVDGVQTTSPLNIYTDNINYPTQADKVAAALNPAVNLYKNNDLRIYSDRDPATGSTSVIGAHTEFLYLNTTSYLFLESNVTRICTFNNEKSDATPVPDAYSFTIDKPATVYLATTAKTYTNILNYGWLIDNTGLIVRRSSISTMQYTEGAEADNKYYAIPNGNGNAYSGIYYRHFAAGANINVPSAGATASSGLIVFIIWDE